MASEQEKDDPEPSSGGAADPETSQHEPAAEDMSSTPFEPGQVIHGKYELLRLLGSGGVGYVVAARHIGFDDLVALKFLRPEFATHQEAVSRFTIEARASFRLRSEHVARMLDVDIHDGVPFIAMELLDGTDLRSVLEARRILEVAPTVDYLLQACEALAAAHAIGVIHRDIKPENLFLLGNGDATDHLKVLDFGISKVAVRGDNRKTHQALTRLAVGTPPYMSPEQVRASSALDARSDIWSVGCVLYELLTGTAPFDRVSLMQACAAVLEDEPPAPRELNNTIPEALSNVIMRCLRKDPGERFADVAGLAEALSPFGSGRFASYAARCQSHLAGEGLGRRSTPTSFEGIRRNSVLPGLASAPPARSITVRLESQAPLSRRVTNAPSGARNDSIGSGQTTRASVPPAAPTPSDLTTRRVVAAIKADEAEPFRPRRRSMHPVAWGVPIVVGGLLATYLATAEQRARSETAPNVHPQSKQEITVTQPATDDKAQAARAYNNDGDVLPSGVSTGENAAAVTASATAEELAQAGAAPRGMSDSASAPTTDRERSSGTATSQRTTSTKKPDSSKSKTTTRPSTRPVSAPAKSTEPSSAPQTQSDPDVGF